MVSVHRKTLKPHRAEKSLRGPLIERRSKLRPTQLDRVKAKDPARAMPSSFIEEISRTLKTRIPATFEAVTAIACRGSDRAKSARITTVEQAMPGKAMDE